MASVVSHEFSHIDLLSHDEDCLLSVGLLDNSSDDERIDDKLGEFRAGESNDFLFIHFPRPIPAAGVATQFSEERDLPDD